MCSFQRARWHQLGLGAVGTPLKGRGLGRGKMSTPVPVTTYLSKHAGKVIDGKPGEGSRVL